MTAAPEPVQPQPPASPSAHRGALWLGLLLVLAGSAWLLSAAGLVDIELRSGVALLVIGLGAVIALDAGHSHHGLVVLAVILSLFGAALTWVDVDVSLLEGGLGDSTAVPTTAAEAAAGYELGVGKLTLDLTSLPEAKGLAATPVKAQVGIGQLYVKLAPDARVVLDAHVGIGDVNVDGKAEGGVDVDRTTLLDGSGATIALKAEVGIGEVYLTRAP